VKGSVVESRHRRDNTDIVVYAEFYQRTGGVYHTVTATFPSTETLFIWRNSIFAAALNSRVQGTRLIPRLFFSANTPTATFSAKRHDFSILHLPKGGYPSLPNARLLMNYIALSLLAFPALPPADRRFVFRLVHPDTMRQYLTIFADFKVATLVFRGIPGGCALRPIHSKIPGST